MAKAGPPRGQLFEDRGLALCVMEALVELDLVRGSIVIPAPAPAEDDDLDDESESWRDRIDDNEVGAIDALVALLEANRDKLPAVRQVHGALIHIAEEYEPDLYSLRGIEACTGLESIGLWSTDPKLDLSPLVALPKLAVVDLACAPRLRNLEPLYELRSLRRVIGIVDARVAAELRRRGIEVASAGA